MTKRWVMGCLIFWGGMLGLYADGKVFPPTAYALPDIPEQQALIQYANGVEKLVIQTSFTGQGTNFAWIVPLPAAPKIEAVTSGLFPTLQFQLRPEVKHNVNPWFGMLISLYALIRLLWKTSGTGKVTLVDWLSCFAFGVGLALFSNSLGPILLFVPAMMFAVQRVRLGTEKSPAILWMILIVGLISSMLLSSLGTSSGGMATNDSVTVHARQTVGSYETAVVSAQKADELLDWLKANGFAAPAAITPIIADYIKDGWVFAAARLARSEQQGASAIHPLMFTFPTKKPVYPMRLTGVGNGNLKVDLYIFGEKRAAAKHFSVTRCAEVTYPAVNDHTRDSVKLIYAGHPGLSNIVENAAVVTKLQATLTPAQMQEDVWPGWEPFQAHQQTLYSRKGAWLTALNLVIPTLLLGCLLQDFALVRRRLGRQLWPLRFSLLGLTLITATAIQLSLPQIPVRLSKARPSWVHGFHATFQYELATELDNMAKTNHNLDVSLWLSQNLMTRFKASEIFQEQNPSTGQPYRQEDSSGNFRIVARTNGFDYFWYDAQGFEHKITYPKTDRD